ncbi:hypothetical protein T10_5422 [Trichinella papuae]|uniref:Uncharacterized protein n=1 Tax=Trichinella papuae TaxID=268474 RepID=A0A0V1N8C9_9BILA|nr:hypothetical protein T10_5422 [Trichinella papuae]
MDKYSEKKERDEFGNSSFNSSREEILLYYERTNMQFLFSGLLIIFLNALLLFVILKLRRRNKYFIIILSACISLLLHGTGYLTASLQRYLMFYLNWLFTETWKCSFWPHLLLFDLGDKGSCFHFSKLLQIVHRKNLFETDNQPLCFVNSPIHTVGCMALLWQRSTNNHTRILLSNTIFLR